MHKGIDTRNAGFAGRALAVRAVSGCLVLQSSSKPTLPTLGGNGLPLPLDFYQNSSIPNNPNKTKQTAA